MKKLLPLLFLFLSFSLVAEEPFDVEKLRAAQQTELDRAQSELRKAAQKPGADQAKLLDDYNAQVREITDRYKALDKRAAEIDEIIKGSGAGPDGKPLIENTGSNPKEIRADVDLAAKTPEAGAAQAEKWRQQGHKVTEVKTDTGEVYKYVNETTDTVLWNPETESGRRAKVEDYDAFSTEGGRQGTGNTTAVKDERGWYLDNEGKYVHAADTGDLKTQAKSVNKAAQGSGNFDPNDPFFQQAQALQNYDDPIQAGIVDPADSPEVARRKIDEWQRRADQEMAKAQDVAERRGDVRDKVRENFQESYETATTADPEAARDNATRAAEIDEARTSVRDSNLAQDAENIKHGADRIDDINTGQAADTTGTGSDLTGSGSAADDLAGRGAQPLTEGRSSFAAQEPGVGAQARGVLDSAGRVLDATAVVGQAADAAARRAGEAIDDNRDLTAQDAGEVALEATGVTPMYDMGSRISTEENIRRERGEQGILTTGARIGARMGGEVADALVNDPVERAIAEEEAAAEREGREPSYVSSAAAATAEIAGNVTGIRQIGDAIYESTTWEERAAAAAQSGALDQHLSSEANLTDRRIGNLQRELERLGMEGDLSDPSTMSAIESRRQELYEANERMERIQAVANRNAGTISEDTVNTINARSSAIPNPEDIDDYVTQLVNDRLDQAPPTAPDGSGEAEDGGRGDYDFFEDDNSQGDLDPAQLAALDDYRTAGDGRTAQGDARDEQSQSREGVAIGPGYTQDRIADAQREREQVERLEDVYDDAGDRYPGPHRERWDSGMDEFAQAPDLDRVSMPENDDDHEGGCCDRPGRGDGAHGGAESDSPPQRPVPSPKPDRDEEPTEKLEPKPETGTEPDSPQESKPEPAPEPRPTPPPPKPPAPKPPAPKPPAAGNTGAPSANFAGSWTGAKSCSASGDAAYRWKVSLSQTGDKVSGSIHFHRCPGGGRAVYSVRGTATDSPTVALTGSLMSSRGPLAGSLMSSRGPLAEQVSKNMRFSVSRNGSPSPNLAP